MEAERKTLTLQPYLVVIRLSKLLMCTQSSPMS